jgi:hypothetical protein
LFPPGIFSGHAAASSHRGPLRLGVPSRSVGQLFWWVNFPLKQSVPTHRPTGQTLSASRPAVRVPSHLSPSPLAGEGSGVRGPGTTDLSRPVSRPALSPSPVCCGWKTSASSVEPRAGVRGPRAQLSSWSPISVANYLSKALSKVGDNILDSPEESVTMRVLTAKTQKRFSNEHPENPARSRPILL